MLKDEVRELVERALKELKIEAPDFTIERPAQAEYGHYAFFASQNAEKIKPEVEKNEMIEKVKVVDGFVNIFLKPEVWHEELKTVLRERENYGLLTIGKEQTVNVEFISANPTGELHVGNGRGAFFGDVLANVLEKAGYNVEREYYVNNASSSTQMQELGKTALGRGDTYLTDYLKKIIEELKPKLDKVNTEQEAGTLVAERILEDIKSFVTESLGIRMDRWFLENELYQRGEVDAVIKKIPSYKKEGAVWAKTEELGDDEDRVLVRSDGTPGYFAADIAYHLEKARRADIIVDVWGADHQGHVKRMYAVGKLLGFAEKLQILISQIVHVKEQGKGKKMSKRAGESVSLSWLINEVGLDAARFFYLSKALSTHMDFDVALAKEQSQKNPVYYVQYSYARSNQIFAKVADKGGLDADSTDLSLLTNPSEVDLIKKLTEYPEVIESIVTPRPGSGQAGYDLQKLTTYAHELSSTYHRFYETSRVLVEDEPLRDARLALVRAYQIVLKDCLGLLGISAPARM